jgi:hypothetical protein
MGGNESTCTNGWIATSQAALLLGGASVYDFLVVNTLISKVLWGCAVIL